MRHKLTLPNPVEQHRDTSPPSKGMDAPFTSFTDEASMPARPPSHVEKVYDRRYLVDVGASGHDYWVCAHPTGVCAVGVCATHALFQQLKSADGQLKKNTSIAFCSIKGKDLETIKTNGKRMSKRDGVWTTSDTVICSVTVPAAETGTNLTELEFLAGVEGKVLQVNTSLQTDPKLLLDRPYDDGYLFVACVFPQQRNKIMNHGLSAEAFCKARSLNLDDIRGGYVDRR